MTNKSTMFCLVFAGVAALAFAPVALGGAAPEEAISVLEQRGYTDVEVDPDERPGYQAWGCKGGTRFSVQMDAQSNIVDVDPVGSCGAPPRHAGNGDVHVRAPFADVKVGKGRVRIRAPFVDLDIR